MRIDSWSGIGLLGAWAVLCLPGFAEPRLMPPEATTPEWPKPAARAVMPNFLRIRSEDIELLHAPEGPGCFVVRVVGKAFAIGQNRPLVGYLDEGKLRWFDLATAEDKRVSVSAQAGSIISDWHGSDPNGAHWQIKHQFHPGHSKGTIEVESEVAVDQDRQVAFLPMLMLFPGVGGFGGKKEQALFAGLEYLEDEPSSSEADVVGPAARRQVPDNLKITFPLMVIQNDDRYLALAWQMRPQFSALFDSPDRLFGSGGHVMGLLFPGSNGKDRQEGNLLPRTARLLAARTPLILRATLLGGSGRTIVPAVQQYVELQKLPPLPAAPNLQQYVAVTAGGWLDSKIRQGPLIRHAIAEGNFAPGPAADAAIWMNWLAVKTQKSDLAGRLLETAKEVRESVPVRDLYGSGVGHVRYPLAPLLFGHVPESIDRATEIARGVLARFEADGSLRYHPNPGGPDFAKTHFTNEASGLVSRAVQDLLEAAAYSGDRELIRAALQRLDAMGKFRNGVPRGAQTWECPLHTPDILAAAQMVRAYTLGYQLTANPAYLEQARYWAWTGVPFVYLVNPTAGIVGSYSTIAVFGATHWQAPVWMGLPVQWCGLVYADALYGLVPHDPKGPWKKLADGITISGIDQSWPATDTQLQGLLPDSFVLRDQHRNGPAINPATLQACATRFFSIPTFGFHCFTKSGLRLYAPGEIDKPSEKHNRISFQLRTWVTDSPYYVLVNGLQRKPQLKIDGKARDCSAPHEFLESAGQLILKLVGTSQIELVL